MALKLLGDISVQFEHKRAERALQLLERYVQQVPVATKEEYLMQLRSRIEIFVNSLGRPIFKDTLIEVRTRPTIEAANKLWEEVSEDLNYLFDLYRQLTEFAQASFNYISGVHQNVQASIANAAIKAVDASLAFGIPQRAVFVAGDSFQSDALIDAKSTAERPFAGSGLTLGREETIRIGPDRFTLDISYNDVSFTDSNGRFAVSAPYEGMLYAPFGQARPEGGVFNFKQEPPATLRSIKGGIQTVTERSGGGGIFATINRSLGRGINGVIRKLGPVGSTIIGAAAVGVTGGLLGLGLSTWGARKKTTRSGSLDRNIIRPSDIVTTLAPTSLVDFANERNKMFDEDPSSFWEIEQSIQLVPEDLDDLLDPDTPEIARTKIEELQNNFPNTGLDVVLGFKFNDLVDLNWININPMHYAPRSNMEVVNIEFSEDGQNFEVLPSFDRNSVATILTEQANTSLDESQQGVTMENNKFEFTGQGLWIFRNTRMRFLRIHLRNRASYVTPYDIVGYQMVKKTSRSRGAKRILGVKIKGGSSTKTIQTETVRLHYLEGLAIFEGQRDVRDYAGETKASASRGKGLNVNVVGTSLYGSDGDNKSTTGWYVGQQWNELRTDIFRYAVGIKELGLYQNRYFAESELISKAFSVPLPIKTIQLHVDERIPEDFDATQRWISYFISVDDGSNWIPIAPVGASMARTNEGERLNQIIDITADIIEGARDPRRTYIEIDEAVQQVRFKAVLQRPGEEAHSTPALSWYRLVMTTVETLTGFEI